MNLRQSQRALAIARDLVGANTPELQQIEILTTMLEHEVARNRTRQLRIQGRQAAKVERQSKGRGLNGAMVDQVVFDPDLP